MWTYFPVQYHALFFYLLGKSHFLFLLELFLSVLSPLDGQVDTTVGAVDPDHADFDLLANIQHVLDLFRGCSPTIAPLTFGQGAFHVVFQADNGTEAGELGDLALDDPAFLITLVDLF